MSDWSEAWKATHANYVRQNKEVKSVLEHRNIDKGELYCVALTGGGFEVREYAGEALKTKTPFGSCVKAVIAYRELRDKKVPNRKATPVAKKEVKMEAKPKAKAMPKAKVAKK